MNTATKFESDFSASDNTFFCSRGVGLGEVRRQLALLGRSEPHRACADRACTVGDGILQIGHLDRELCVERGRKALASGRLTDFIPASGAATRMFADLIQALVNGAEYLQGIPTASSEDKTAMAVLQIFKSLRKLPFYKELRDQLLCAPEMSFDIEQFTGDELLRGGRGVAVIKAMIEPKGLALDMKPKALIPFHIDQGNIPRSALAEHIFTAAQLGGDLDGKIRMHFTCSSEHLDAIRNEAKVISQIISASNGLQFEIELSVQNSATDTICMGEDGLLARDDSGTPILRPGGHGALLFNLANLAKNGADLVYINNIDNVHPQVHPSNPREKFIESKLLLLGVLSEAQAVIHRTIRALRDPELSVQCMDELHSEIDRQLSIKVPECLWHGADLRGKAELLTGALDRPVRVVGVVANTGEPGGGPFWVRGPDGSLTRQVVERHELDPANSQQQAIFNAGTHFNPVRIVCGLKNPDGRPYNLHDFTDPNSVLISRKSISGRPVKILELPGLWNGSMAQWITLFVEVPAETFAPVKTVSDLARASHQSNSTT